jgi:hypothetical protein
MENPYEILLPKKEATGHRFGKASMLQKSASKKNSRSVAITPKKIFSTFFQKTPPQNPDFMGIGEEQKIPH